MAENPATDPRLWDEADTPFAHMYPQFIWHGDALFVGNEPALRALAAAAVEACGSGRATIQLFASDGEGYGLSLERTNTTGLSYTRLPYIVDFARNDEDDYARFLRSRIAYLESLLVAAGIDAGDPDQTEVAA